MKDLIIGIVATLWGTAVVIKVSMKILEADPVNSYQVGSLIGGLMGFALAIWGIVKIRNWSKNR
jgi:hypothetical protein